MASLVTILRDMCYPTPRELALAARALADEHPREVRIRQVGTSRAGQPLWLLSVDAVGPAGPGQNVLVVAGAHANEPVGGATVLSLARRLLREPAPRAGCGWHFLLCADPDGADLHRTPRPYSLLDYHRHFYRPPGPEQPEWAPSLLAPDRLPPETLALTGLIDELRPVLQASLHATDLGGSWVQLTRDVPGLAEPFGKSAAELRIPVENGASDAAGWPSPGPGIFVIPQPGAGQPEPSTPRTPGSAPGTTPTGTPAPPRSSKSPCGPPTWWTTRPRTPTRAAPCGCWRRGSTATPRSSPVSVTGSRPGRRRTRTRPRRPCCARSTGRSR